MRGSGKVSNYGRLLKRLSPETENNVVSDDRMIQTLTAVVHLPESRPIYS